MDWLNYHHLLYFWTVAREGSVSRAAAKLHLAQPTVSGQLRTLEEQLGEKLFQRHGRGLLLTETGRLVFRYADQIFTLGRELGDALRGRPAVGRPLRLVVGVADVIPKGVAHVLLAPALAIGQPVRIACREDGVAPLLGMLATHEIDLLLSDSPVGAGAPVRVYSHLLGECGVSFCGAASLWKRGARFPAALDRAPMLLPAEHTQLRRSLDEWFDATGVHPEVVGEFDDSALMTAFGGAGAGIFPVPSVIARDTTRQHNVKILGQTDAVTARFFAISAARKLEHPAVVAISEAARTRVFG